jgi:hypothetical protein
MPRSPLTAAAMRLRLTVRYRSAAQVIGRMAKGVDSCWYENQNGIVAAPTEIIIAERLNSALSGEISRLNSRMSTAPRPAISMATPGWSRNTIAIPRWTVNAIVTSVPKPIDTGRSSDAASSAVQKRKLHSGGQATSSIISVPVIANAIATTVRAKNLRPLLIDYIVGERSCLSPPLGVGTRAGDQKEKTRTRRRRGRRPSSYELANNVLSPTPAGAGGVEQRREHARKCDKTDLHADLPSKSLEGSGVCEDRP